MLKLPKLYLGLPLEINVVTQDMKKTTTARTSYQNDIYFLRQQNE